MTDLKSVRKGDKIAKPEIRISFVSGLILGLLAPIAIFFAAPDVVAATHYICGVRSADGCMVWVNKHRADRYTAGKAGTVETLWRPQ